MSLMGWSIRLQVTVYFCVTQEDSRETGEGRRKPYHFPVAIQLTC